MSLWVRTTHGTEDEVRHPGSACQVTRGVDAELPDVERNLAGAVGEFRAEDNIAEVQSNVADALPEIGIQLDSADTNDDGSDEVPSSRSR